MRILAHDIFRGMNKESATMGIESFNRQNPTSTTRASAAFTRLKYEVQ